MCLTSLQLCWCRMGQIVESLPNFSSKTDTLFNNNNNNKKPMMFFTDKNNYSNSHLHNKNLRKS
jgi:hypothetical protein